MAGAEAVISHLVVRTFQIPCAHAPALSPLPIDPALSPRSAAEELGYTFLPCVLVGLSRSPQFINPSSTSQPSDIWADQVDAVIIPATACGGSAVLSFSHTSTQIITVSDNHTRLNVSAEQLGIPILNVHSYLEALGVLVVHRAGISAAALRSDLASIREL